MICAEQILEKYLSFSSENCHIYSLMIIECSCYAAVFLQGARKDGKSPDGQSYMDCAETDDIKVLLNTK